LRSAGIQGAGLEDLWAEMGRRCRGSLCPVPFTLEEDACRPTAPLPFALLHLEVGGEGMKKKAKKV